jgi:hypothetical protein
MCSQSWSGSGASRNDFIGSSGASICCFPGTFFDATTQMVNIRTNKYANPPTVSNAEISFLCDKCPPGRITNSPNVDTTCVACIKGTYQDEVGQFICKSCTSGKWSNVSGLFVASGCVDCEAGKYSSPKGAESIKACVDCPPGRKGDVSTIGADDANSCTECDNAKFSNQSGSTSCMNVEPGYEREPSGTIQVKCAAGKAGAGGSSKCKDCDAGKKAENPGTIQCGECDVGYTSGKGSARCLPCEAGMFMGVGQSSCKNCFPGQYRENKKGSDSTAVDTGTGTGTGGTSGTAGIGDTGGTGGTGGTGTATTGTATTGTATTGTATTGTATTGTATTGTGTAGGLDESTDPTTCVDCPTGWASDSGSTKCQRCEAGKKAIEGGGPGCTICPQHQYRESHERDSDGQFLPLKPTDPTTCVECPAGWRSDAGIGAGATKCDSCDAGRFSDHVLDPENSEDCLDCAEGKYRESKEEDGITITNPTKCLDCPTGWMSKGGSTRCQACGAGTFGDGCKSCPIGYARNRTDPDATQCRLCQLGETTTLIGSASCERW